MKTEGKLDWEQVGQQLDRPASNCYNQYIKMTEQWTAGEDEILGKYWEANYTDFDIAKVMPMLEGHTKRGAQFRLK